MTTPEAPRPPGFPRADPIDGPIVGLFDRERLPTVLAAIHRAGFGPQARVLDGVRGDLAAQLQRAGVRPRFALAADEPAVVVLVNAPGRGARVAAVLEQVGARTIEVDTAVSRPPALSPPSADVAVPLPTSPGREIADS